MSNDDRSNIHMKTNSIVRLKSSSVRDILLDKAMIKLRREEYLDAVSLLNKVIDMDPKHPASRKLLIDALMEISCYDKALWEIAGAIVEFGETDDFLMKLGNLYLETEQFAAAYDAYNLVRSRINDESDDEMIDALIDAMDYCEAMLDEDDDSFIMDEEAFGEGTDDEYLIHDVADLEHDEFVNTLENLYNDEEYSKIIEILEPYAYRNSWDSVLASVLLMSYYCAREFQRGAKYLKAMSKKANYSVSMHCVAAMIYKNADMLEEAEAECHAALHQQPDLADDALRVCAMLCEMGKDNEQVLKYARICYNMRPYEKEIIHLYARSLAISGDTAAAAKLYSRILSIYPGDIPAKYYRDMCIRGEAIDSDTIPVSYTLQAGEILAMTTACIIRMKSNSKLSASECRETQELAKWALDSGNYNIAMSLITFMGPFKAQMQNLCQYIIKNPNFPEKIKMLALNEIGLDEGMDSSLFFKDDRLLIVKIQQRKRSKPREKTDVPSAYSLLDEAVREYLEKHEGEPWKDSALKLVDEFTAEGAKERTRYTNAQIEAICAAIIFFAPFAGDETNKVHIDDKCKEYAVERSKALIDEYLLSTVRFNNAVQLLIKYSKTAKEAAKQLGMEMNRV